MRASSQSPFHHAAHHSTLAAALTPLSQHSHDESEADDTAIDVENEDEEQQQQQQQQQNSQQQQNANVEEMMTGKFSQTNGHSTTPTAQSAQTTELLIPKTQHQLALERQVNGVHKASMGGIAGGGEEGKLNGNLNHNNMAEQIKNHKIY
ncbi:protein elav-like [Lucilia cuprina]|uniref:protein elav-like n=1 Tax=Lucilia cuprina TaxID=7375 RepID=UPI001F062DAE|nr:protein elav-like [Lucilia cuprina]